MGNVLGHNTNALMTVILVLMMGRVTRLRVAHVGITQLGVTTVTHALSMTLVPWAIACLVPHWIVMMVRFALMNFVTRYLAACTQIMISFVMIIMHARRMTAVKAVFAEVIRSIAIHPMILVWLISATLRSAVFVSITTTLAMMAALARRMILVISVIALVFQSTVMMVTRARMILAMMLLAVFTRTTLIHAIMTTSVP